ncbi:MAG: Spherulation-specific family 4-domain-containing protein [Monoraphidium minutum]|nr:MAG: Spherulation-specific family 4-domain-containing protein [Monoraphidium minutum]
MLRLVPLLLLAAAAAAAQSTGNSMGIWSPLYYKINPSRDDEYAKFISAVAADKCLTSAFQGAILTGPTSRPPPLKNDDSPGREARGEEYQRRFDYLYDAGGWQPFGYIYTNYARRPLDAVLEDVTRWCDAVNGYRGSIRGVFIDSVVKSFEDDAEVKGYYDAVVAAVKSECSDYVMVMLNPGTAFTECAWLQENNIGFVNGFEDTYKTYQESSASKGLGCPCKDTKLADGSAVRCIASVHSVPEDIDEAGAGALMQDFSDNGFSAIFLTEGRFPKHYETVPTIWPVTAKAACKVQAYTPGAAAASNATAADGAAAGARRLLSGNRRAMAA